MFLRQLEYLIAVIEEDHFGRAAEKCYVKQPSLSNGIKQLESELGITLFKRGRGQRLYGITEEGKKVSKWARLILANFNAMRDEIGRNERKFAGKIADWRYAIDVSSSANYFATNKGGLSRRKCGCSFCWKRRIKSEP